MDQLANSGDRKFNIFVDVVFVWPLSAVAFHFHHMNGEAKLALIEISPPLHGQQSFVTGDLVTVFCASSRHFLSSFASFFLSFSTRQQLYSSSSSFSSSVMTLAAKKRH